MANVVCLSIYANYVYLVSLFEIHRYIIVHLLRVKVYDITNKTIHMFIIRKNVNRNVCFF